jgi:peptidoglycan/LPS O-acetylase OafA/YrhL
VRLNNFDLLRLALAVAVACEHAYLVGLKPLRLGAFGAVFDGYAAVECFFVISGYLIFQSWEASSSLRSYAAKRIRRVYPAYAAVVIVMALAGAWLTSLAPADYFTWPGWLRYVAANLLFLNFLQLTLPGVFATAAEPWVNGPLWTIKIEIMFYMCVPLLALLRRRIGFVWIFVALYVGSVAWSLLFDHLRVATGRDVYAILERQLPGQMAFFVSGGLLYYYADAFKRHAGLFAAVGLAVVIAHYKFDLPWLYPAALAAVVIYAAERLPYLGNFGRFGDMSYGLYVVHYPVLQVIAALGLFALPGTAFAAGLAISVLLAFLSWHLIEKPTLHRSSHYRTAEAGAGALPPERSGAAG